MSSTDTVAAILALLDAGRHADALAVIDDRADELDDPYLRNYLRARGYAAAGRAHRMVVSLRTAFDEDRTQRDTVRAEPWIAPWLRDPRVVLLFAAADDLGLAFDAMMEGDLDEAADLLSEPDAMTDPPTAWMLRTMLHLQTDEPEAALAAGEKVVSAHPKLPEGWFNLAAARAQTGDDDGAIAAYQQAVAVEPEHANSWFNLGDATRAAGRNDESRAAFLEAARQEPRRPLFWYRAAEAAALVGDLDAAEAAIRAAGALDPGVFGAIEESPIFVEAFGAERLRDLVDTSGGTPD